MHAGFTLVRVLACFLAAAQVEALCTEADKLQYRGLVRLQYRGLVSRIALSNLNHCARALVRLQYRGLISHSV